MARGHHGRTTRRRTWGLACAAQICAALLLIVLVILASGIVARAQQSPAGYHTKAAYLLNFLKFVGWPEDAYADPMGQWVIGIVGDDPFGDDLGRMTIGQIVEGRTLVNRRFLPGSDYRECHILFISASEKKHLRTILNNLRGTSILTVSDMDHFLESGGMVQFTMEDNHVELAINVAATSQARLKVSSKLLTFARRVIGIEPGAGN
jgi:YfiR/HmsC-like